MSHPTPEMFATATPPRIMGDECEYDYQGATEGALIHRNTSARHVILPGEVAEEFGLAYLGQYLSNGARLYPDVGHIEYASPESLGPRQAVAASFAGIKIMQRVMAYHVEDTGNKGARLYRNSGTFVPAGNNRRGVATRGFHENYQIPYNLCYDPLLRSVMSSFLASRIWSGSGIVTRQGYWFSQKAAGVTAADQPFSYGLGSRTDQDGNKPMFIITPPDDVYASDDKQDWVRFEVRLADAGHSKDAQFLAKAATSLVLRLIEHQKEFGHDLQAITLTQPGAANRIFSSDLTLKRTSKSRDNQDLTALDIQNILLEMGVKLGEEHDLPEDERAALQLWEETLADLEASDPTVAHYPSRLSNRFDFAGRHRYLAKREGADRLTIRNTSALHRSLVWDRVHPKGGAEVVFDRNGSDYVTPDEVEELISNPPERTRAKTRAETIRTASKDDSVTWSTVTRANTHNPQSLGNVYV